MGFPMDRGKLKVGPLGADGSEEPDASLVKGESLGQYTELFTTTFYFSG